MSIYKFQKGLKIIYYSLPFVFAVYIAVSFMISKNLFNNSDIYFEDYPRFIFKSYILFYNNILGYTSVFGYYPNLYSGIPMIQFYPIGLFFITNFLHVLGFSYSDSLKILIFISFILLSYTPFIISLLYNKSLENAVISSAWLMFAVNSLTYNLFEYGMIPFVLAAICTILLLSFLGKRDFHDEQSKNMFVNRNDYLLLFLFVFGILLNYMAIVFAGFCMILYLMLLAEKTARINYILFCL